MNRPSVSRPLLLLRSLQAAFKALSASDPLRLAGATAFFTTFALPAILIIILSALRLVFIPRNISRQLFTQLEELVGRETTQDLIHTLRAFRSIAENWLIAIGGFIFLLFVATTLFKVIKDSLNQVWAIRSVRRRSFKSIMRSRLRGVLVILFTGLLFILGLFFETALAFLGKYIQQLVPELITYYRSAFSYLISIVTATLWFALVFYLLPDGRPRLKILFTGALVTSILFNIGKLVLRWLLTYSNINNIYGASASIVLLLLFVFYCSLIFYFGASFTNVWADANGVPVEPLPYAKKYRIADVKEEDE